jgi:predicted nucleic acid-binding protein
MIAYVDSSILLRLILRQPDALAEWSEVTHAVASSLVELECLRTLDRLRIAESLEEDLVASLRESVFRLIATFEIVEVTRPILARAAQPMPTTLGSLDAVHLASALLWTELGHGELVMATHDNALAKAARAFGLRTVGGDAA